MLLNTKPDHLNSASPTSCAGTMRWNDHILQHLNVQIVVVDLHFRSSPSKNQQSSSLSSQQPKNQPNPPNDMHPIAPQRRPFRPHFTYLYRLVLTRSRAAECRKANHFSAHLALLVGPDTLSRPATTPKLPGGAPAGHGWAPRGAQPALNGARPAHRPAPGNPPGGGRSSRQLSSGRHLIKTHNLQIK